jgi:hypothetical protein
MITGGACREKKVAERSGERESAEICTWIEMFSYKNEWTRDNVGGQGRRGPMHPDVSTRGGLPLGMASDFLPCRTSDQEYYCYNNGT